MDDDLYEELRQEFKLQPFYVIVGAQIIRFIAISYLFLDLPSWQRFGAFALQLTFAEIVAATGWPFFHQPGTPSIRRSRGVSS